MKKIIIVSIALLLFASFSSFAFADFEENSLEENDPFLIYSDKSTYKDVFKIVAKKTGTAFVYSDSAEIAVLDKNYDYISCTRRISKEYKTPKNMYCFGAIKGHTYYIYGIINLEKRSDSYYGSIIYSIEKNHMGGKTKAKAKKIKMYKDNTFVMPADNRSPQYFKFTTKKKKIMFSMNYANCNGSFAYVVWTKKGKGGQGYITDKLTGKKSVVIKQRNKKKRTYYVMVYPKRLSSSGAFHMIII